MKHGLALMLVLALALTPDLAEACAVCFDSRAETRWAFILTTAFLTFLPLTMLAGAGLWLRHRVRVVNEAPSTTQG